MLSEKTYLDDIIEFKYAVIKSITSSKKVMGLLLNDPNIDLDGDDALDALKNNIFDFDYVDRTIQRSDAFIMVDTEMVKPSSGSMNVWHVYIQIVSEKGYNALDKKIFKGVKGNRKDNIAREVDLLLNGRDDFGIGKLTLKSVSPSTVPESFTSTLLTYVISDFREERLNKLDRN